MDGGLVHLEEFEDPVEDSELNRVQAEMQAAIALLNAPQNLPEEEEEEAVNLPGAQTPPQTPSEANLISRLMSAASASANAPSLAWDADIHLREIAAQIA